MHVLYRATRLASKGTWERDAEEFTTPGWETDAFLHSVSGVKQIGNCNKFSEMIMQFSTTQQVVEIHQIVGNHFNYIVRPSSAIKEKYKWIEKETIAKNNDDLVVEFIIWHLKNFLFIFFLYIFYQIFLIKSTKLNNLLFYKFIIRVF